MIMGGLRGMARLLASVSVLSPPSPAGWWQPAVWRSAGSGVFPISRLITTWSLSAASGLRLVLFLGLPSWNVGFRLVVRPIQGFPGFYWGEGGRDWRDDGAHSVCARRRCRLVGRDVRPGALQFVLRGVVHHGERCGASSFPVLRWA